MKTEEDEKKRIMVFRRLSCFFFTAILINNFSVSQGIPPFDVMNSRRALRAYIRCLPLKSQRLQTNLSKANLRKFTLFRRNHASIGTSNYSLQKQFRICSPVSLLLNLTRLKFQLFSAIFVLKKD